MKKLRSPACGKQENAIFPPHIHGTWGPPFRPSLYVEKQRKRKKREFSLSPFDIPFPNARDAARREYGRAGAGGGPFWSVMGTVIVESVANDALDAVVIGNPNARACFPPALNMAWLKYFRWRLWCTQSGSLVPLRELILSSPGAQEGGEGGDGAADSGIRP